ncbi:hypothetical protein BOTCAL_0035g00210 [Botryotinia calthae]|uniref:Uncharacterized protein n=1 Tax=Botryotinia calthae TaxID=38488 RepID=A0A4Y8DF15_9HELO|nr:hypothetical protein BOTCAL_0035g00210 [Botryotinia calthae]
MDMSSIDHESDQVARQANQDHNNRSELVHGLDEIQPQESNGDEDSHGSSQMNVREISVNGHDRGYAWPFNLGGLHWRIQYLEWTRKILHRRVDTASVAVAGDAIDADFPAEEPSLPRTSTLFPKMLARLIHGAWSPRKSLVILASSFFIAHGPGLIQYCSDEIQKRRARSLHLTRFPQGDSSTSRALINFDIDLVIVPEEVLDLYRQIEHWDKIQKLCVIIYNVSNNRVSPLTMQRLNQLSTP